MPALCRDCFQDAAGARCSACGSPRILQHSALHQLSIAHIDCDAFYATIEKRDDPSLLDKPLIIGGGRRGVVSTCCYIARTYGVRSAMPMFKALKLCPNAVVISPNMEKYAAVGREVRRRMQELTPLVEPLSIDEAFLDLSGTERLHQASPARVLARFAGRIEREIGISISIGLSGNKFLAKIASDLDKPRGFAVISLEEAPAFLAERPVSFIWGVGTVSAQRFAKDGFRTIGDLQRAGQVVLAKRYGEEGLRLARLAFGKDVRRVEPEHETKSISAETTFNEDIADIAMLVPVLWDLAEKVSARLKKAELAGSTVTLKLKTADFKIRTRARTLHEPTRLATRIFEAARELLEPEAMGTKFRLMGIGIAHFSDIAEADQGDLIDEKARRLVATEAAMDAVRLKFGKGAMKKGIGLKV